MRPRRMAADEEPCRVAAPRPGMSMDEGEARLHLRHDVVQGHIRAEVVIDIGDGHAALDEAADGEAVVRLGEAPPVAAVDEHEQRAVSARGRPVQVQRLARAGSVGDVVTAGPGFARRFGGRQIFAQMGLHRLVADGGARIEMRFQRRIVRRTPVECHFAPPASRLLALAAAIVP